MANICTLHCSITTKVSTSRSKTTDRSFFTNEKYTRQFFPAHQIPAAAGDLRINAAPLPPIKRYQCLMLLSSSCRFVNRKPFTSVHTLPPNVSLHGMFSTTSHHAFLDLPFTLPPTAERELLSFTVPTLATRLPTPSSSSISVPIFSLICFRCASASGVS